MDNKQEMSDHRENMREFKDRLGQPVDQQTREAIMGISSDLDKFVIERNILAAQLEQMRMEQSELRDLRELRDMIAAMFRGGMYRLEKAHGYIDGQSYTQVAMHYLLLERSRFWVRSAGSLGGADMVVSTKLFEPVGEVATKALLVCSQANEKRGKTHFALTAPGSD